MTTLSLDTHTRISRHSFRQRGLLRRHASSACFEALEPRVLYSGNTVVEWNNIAIDAIRHDTSQPGPGWASRNMAIMHAAIFDAVNAIDQSFTPYLVNLKVPHWVSMDAAAATAAEVVLAALYPAQRATFRADLAADLAHISKGLPKLSGMMLGDYVAQRILFARAHDGATQNVTYTPSNDIGKWRPTPPDYSPAWGPNWGQVKPFAIQSSTQFDAPPPPALTSADYAAAYNYVASVGAADSTTRTADETQTVDFWAYDTQTMGTPIAHYNQIIQGIAAQQGNTMVQDARLFALANIAMADAGITCWQTKFQYDLWRPITAIQNGNLDANPGTVGDPTWTPLGAPNGNGARFTPPFPTYTSGHATFGNAVFGILAQFYGTDNIHFSATSDELPGVVRSFDSFSQAANENAYSRVYMGVHFLFDCDQGQLQGQQIANYIYPRILQPVSKTPAAQAAPHDANALPSALTSANSSLLS